mmetsp:Transcript_35311/g.77338  ORF Transcript_35311/g.77338 Transcript_35311/m.77338 type:complete len:209 (-) Transcript_35311:334-960(-)
MITALVRMIRQQQALHFTLALIGRHHLHGIQLTLDTSFRVVGDLAMRWSAHRPTTTPTPNLKIAGAVAKHKAGSGSQTWSGWVSPLGGCSYTRGSHWSWTRPWRIPRPGHPRPSLATGARRRVRRTVGLSRLWRGDRTASRQRPFPLRSIDFRSHIEKQFIDFVTLPAVAIESISHHPVSLATTLHLWIPVWHVLPAQHLFHVHIAVL